MKLDIERLREAHPVLPPPTAEAYSHRAALALGRRHAPDVEARASVDDDALIATLSWAERPRSDALHLDYHRVTEDGAEAVALAFVSAARSWTVLRRLQREEHADWLLRDSTTRRLVALEVSGTDEGGTENRLTAKLAQAARSPAARTKAACVVGFVEPCILLATARDGSR